MAPTFEDDDSLFNFVMKDGNGVKGLVDTGIKTVPERYIQPAQERIDPNKVASSHKILTIDLSDLDGPNHDQVMDAIANAAETVGFFQVVNHGVPLELLESLKDAATGFFGQSAEKKSVYLKDVSPSPLVKYGSSYVPEKEKALEWNDNLIMIYDTEAEALQFWPDECKGVALEYLKTSEKMVRRLLEVLMTKLGVTLTESKVDGLMALRAVQMNFYPACPNPELTIGIGRHSDMGTITVLLQDDIGGLYVKVERSNEESGGEDEWLEVPPVAGALIINIGDSLQIISNGKYKSAEHRSRTSTRSRVSVPIFNVPSPTEIIGPLPELVERDGFARYRDILFEDYKNNYLANVSDGKKNLEFVQS